MTEPAPLGPTRDDPAVQAAIATQAPYVAKIDAIRSDPHLSELAKAEQLSEAYEQQMTVLNQHAQDLYGRRTARRDHLAAQLPIGPGVTPDMSAADKAVLQAAFRARLEEVGQAKLEQRHAMLGEAIRYGDDTTIRAVLTYADNHNEGQTLDVWAQQTGNEALLAEIRNLNQQLGGIHDGSGWERQAFRTPQRPFEAANVSALRRRAEEQARKDMRARQYQGIPRY
ncbi:hypothetical protein ACWDA3_55570 [Nonomuraea rubra]